MQGILFDLDGVLYVGESAVDGAADVLHWVNESNIPHLFVTNTTSRPRRSLVGKLARLGIIVEADKILTPAVAAARWLHEQHADSLALFVPQGTREEFSEFTQIEQDAASRAGTVIVGDLGRAWNFDTINCAFTFLMQNPKPAFIALGMTRYWRSEEGLQLDTGPFVCALEYASGQKAIVMGKPERAFYQAAASLLGLAPTDIVMIGDDIQGDISGAQSSNMRTALVKTGKYQESDLLTGIKPDIVLDSVAGLPQWWDQQP